jgi:hypothetical protein
MERVVSVRPAGFWGLWCRLAAGVVAVGRNDYAVEVVAVGRNDYVVEVVGVVVDEGFGYAVVMAVVGVVVE